MVKCVSILGSTGSIGRQSLDIIGVAVDEALYAVYGLTGENVSDEVVNEVFSKFCVGK